MCRTLIRIPGTLQALDKYQLLLLLLPLLLSSLLSLPFREPYTCVQDAWQLTQLTYLKYHQLLFSLFSFTGVHEQTLDLLQIFTTKPRVTFWLVGLGLLAKEQQLQIHVHAFHEGSTWFFGLLELIPLSLEIFVFKQHDFFPLENQMIVFLWQRKSTT